MSAERRVQELRPCGGDSDACGPDISWSSCPGCAAPEHPGQRWVTVGTLVDRGMAVVAVEFRDPPSVATERRYTIKEAPDDE